MSVIIKGMQMPSECRMCPLCRYFYSVGTTRCMITQATLAEGYKTISFEGRHKDCPLAELPEKHGDLIDADALIAKYGDWYTEEGTEAGFIGTIGMLLKDAPTVVEVEGD